MGIDKSGMTEAGRFARDGFDAAEELEAAAEAAKRYVSLFPWCKKFKKIYFDRGMVHAAVFYCEIEPNPPADPNMWVIFGDLSPLFLDVEVAENGAQAMAAYVAVMQNLIDSARKGRSLDRLPPLATRDGMYILDPTPARLDALESRLEFIRSRMITEWTAELTGWELEPFEDEAQ